MKRRRGSFVRVALPCLLVGATAHVTFAWMQARRGAEASGVVEVGFGDPLAHGPRRTESASASDPNLVVQLVDTHVQCPTLDTCRVDPRLLEFILAEPDRVRQQGTLVPVIDGTGVVGVALYDVPSRGLFGALGLRDGDIVTDVDGVRVDGPDACFDALARGPGPGALEVGFLRDGRPLHRRIELTRQTA